MTAAARHAPTVADVEHHLRESCAGVFTEDAVARHVTEHVGMEPARRMAAHVRVRAPYAASLLDVGCGYGSFVLAAREAGLDAVGVEPAGFELRFARGRLTRERPADDPDGVYLQGSGAGLPFEAERFDVVTLWNVIEHVPDTPRLLGEAVRVLRPGGRLFLLAPNYLAFRREAHYLVPWLPLLPRPVARCYLRVLGRDPRFLDEEIVYCTAPGVRRALRRLPVRIVDPRLEKLGRPEAIVEPRARAVATVTQRAGASTVLGFALGASARNPLRKAIQVEAVKQGGGR